MSWARRCSRWVPPWSAAGGLVQHAHAVLERFEVGLDGGQRGAHLVGEVGEDSPPGALHVTEAFGEVVDRGRQLVELGAQARAGDAGAELTLGDPGRGVRHVRGGALDPAGEVPVTSRAMRTEVIRATPREMIGAEPNASSTWAASAEECRHLPRRGGRGRCREQLRPRATVAAPARSTRACATSSRV